MTDIVGNRTLRSQWNETVQFNPDQIFLEYISVKDEVSRYTYVEFDRMVKRTANFFLALGVQKGELIALHLHNSPQYMVCWLALAQIGAVAVPFNEHYRYDESRYVLKECDIHSIIVETASLESCYAGRFEELGLRRVIRVDGGGEGVYDLYKEIAGQPAELQEDREIGSNDPAVILFTSGTTRHPKGAVYTHACVVYGGLLHAHQIGMCRGDRFLSAMPCYHMDFQEMAAMPVICMGGTLVMVEHYSARRFWRQVCEHRANFTDTMSIMNRTMLLQPVQPWEKDHCLKQVYFSMGLSEDELNAFESRFGVRLLNSYGMTETVSAVTCSPLVGERRWPSVGRAALSYDIKIVHPDGSECAPNEEGEICVKGVPGRTLVSGYYRNEEATAKLYPGDGWLHSGDAGYLDEDGWLFFLGRYGDMIKRSGENISALEVECVLTSHPDIADAAVIGVPDPMRDYAVKAFIQLRAGAALSSDDVTEYCKGKLSSFKVPTLIEFVEEFPRTATGKIKKKQLA